MANILKIPVIAYLLILGFAGVTSGCTNYSANSEELKDVLIIGSAEHPDPVLEKVINLEKKGILKNVIIMESFPIQIRATGPKDVIEKLQKMPRVVSHTFK